MHFELEQFGYGFFQEQHRLESGVSRDKIARVVSDSREKYLIQTSHGIYRATIAGKLRHVAETRRDLPAVGDWVAFTCADHENAVIDSVFPRRTNLERSAVGKLDIQIIAANVDTAFVVISADRDFRINRIDRYLALILNGGINPVVLINKCDLLADGDWRDLEMHIFRRHPAVEIFATSLVSGMGLEEVRQIMKAGQTFCFTGSSGVGKSSLINHFAGEHLFETSQISQTTSRGCHTTTSRHLHMLPNGALLLDTPGMREVAMSDADNGVGATFAEIEALTSECRFTDCTHTNEPGCAILAAIASAAIDENAFNSYQKLKRESARFEQKMHDRRRADKNFGKMAREVLKMKKILKG
ncbi:MAG: ribosome small subunit-dependent GTPase A [Candidatus Riflebacteria bacterium]|nr:ribosome small subunit-dependent GTPase A [Candidatus Riflebacteria bacterium]